MKSTISGASCGSRRARLVKRTERAVGTGHIRELLLWTGPNGDVFLEEDRILTIPETAENEPCVITWQSTFTVAEDAADAVITGTNYNGLGIRFLESMDKGRPFSE